MGIQFEEFYCIWLNNCKCYFLANLWSKIGKANVCLHFYLGLCEMLETMRVVICIHFIRALYLDELIHVLLLFPAVRSSSVLFYNLNASSNSCTMKILSSSHLCKISGWFALLHFADWHLMLSFPSCCLLILCYGVESPLNADSGRYSLPLLVVYRFVMNIPSIQMDIATLVTHGILFKENLLSDTTIFFFAQML